MSTVAAEQASPESVRARLVDAAAALLHERGAEAVTTRAVAQAAGMRAPTIYRLFGDKDGLLDAVAEHEMAVHVAAKQADVADACARDIDPVDDLRAGWHLYVGFGLAHPALFPLINDPRRPAPSPAAATGLEVLRARVRRVAAAGRLRVGERRAVDLLYATGSGTVLTLLAAAPGARDPDLADAVYDALARAIFTESPVRSQNQVGNEVVAAAVTLRAAAPTLPALTSIERSMLGEWLDRTVTSLHQPPAAHGSTAPPTDAPRGPQV